MALFDQIYFNKVVTRLRRASVWPVVVSYMRGSRKFCQRGSTLTSFFFVVVSIQYVHGDLCKYLGIDSSTDHESIPKFLHKSPCACRILKNDLIL